MKCHHHRAAVAPPRYGWGKRGPSGIGVVGKVPVGIIMGRGGAEGRGGRAVAHLLAESSGLGREGVHPNTHLRARALLHARVVFRVLYVGKKKSCRRRHTHITYISMNIYQGGQRVLGRAPAARGPQGEGGQKRAV